MTAARRFLALWAVGAAALAPLHGLLPGVGSGLVAAAVGGAFLFTGRQTQDGGLRKASVAVGVFCTVVWLGTTFAALP